MSSLDSCGISQPVSRPPESGGQRDPKGRARGGSEGELMKMRFWNPLSRDFDFVSITLSP